MQKETIAFLLYKLPCKKKDCEVFEKISGRKASRQPFELDPLFYYPTPELLMKWKNRDLPDTPYVLP
jgi:hypothetical protein